MQRAMTGPRRAKAWLLALTLGSAAILTACAEEGASGSGGGGEGLPAGATMEEYQAAFEDVDPISLDMQTPGPKESATSAPMEKWAAAIEEWSGGKITFEIAFSNAIAEPTEIDDALNDGRLDVGSTLPIYEPDEYRVNEAINQTAGISNQTPVLGALQSNAWPNEVAFNNEELMAEYEDHGLVPLVPIFNSGSQAIFCSEPRTSLDDFDGVSITAAGPTQAKQVQAIGAAPTSIAYTEMFESLQRGVVDCANTSTTVTVLGGFTAEAPHMTLSPEAGFAIIPGSWTFSKATWDTLPLVAQQLIWDQLGIYVASNIEDKIWPNDIEASRIIRESGGSVSEFDAEALAALQAEGDKRLEDLRSTDSVSDGDALVDDSIAAADKWLEKLREIGYPEGEITYENLAEELDPAEIDMAAYIDVVMTEIWSSRRPG